VVAFVVWFGYGIADACNACLARAGHAVIVRDKMRRCTAAQYKRLSTEYTADIMQECNQGDITWAPVCSESYGPQRQIKKRERRSKTVQKKRTRSHASRVDPTAVMTHRNAPFSLPLAHGSFWLSSRFGPRPRADGSSGFHYGIDLAANRGTPVYAARAGVVLYAGHDNGYGKTIVLQHGVHFKTRYAHLDRISVHTGDTVARGARIGTVGATGHVRKRGGDGSHLHFEIYSQGKRVDPLQFLPDFVS
jgi:murein DD-endopeptidase MepM/ murein hydrolase activator NlpD